MNIVANGENGGTTPKQQFLRVWEQLCRATDKAPHIAEMKQFLCAHPEFARAELNLRDNARRAALTSFAGNLGSIGCPYYLDQARALEERLAGQNATPAVRALAEQAATDYLWLTVLQSVGTVNDIVEKSHRRYLRTLKMLATVRRLERGMDIHITHEMRNRSVVATEVPAGATADPTWLLTGFPASGATPESERA